MAQLRVAVPLAAVTAGQQLMGLVDTAVVGHISPHTLAAMSVGRGVHDTLFLLGMGMLLGLDPLMSQALGASDRNEARRLLWQGLWLSGALGVVLGGVMVVAPWPLKWAGIEPSVVDSAAGFLWIRGPLLLSALGVVVVRGFLQAHQHTRTLLVATLVANVVNAPLCVVLALGGRGVPWLPEWLAQWEGLGIRGAALATSACTFLQLGIMLRAVAWVGGPSQPGERGPQWQQCVRVWRVGVPVAIQLGAEVGAFFVVGILAARLGAIHAAAHQVSLMVASVSYTMAVGVGSAASVRVGRAIGALDTPAARRAGFTAFACATAVMGPAGLLYALIPAQIAGVFSPDDGVTALAAALLRVAAVFQLADGIQAVGAGALRGAGDTHFLSMVNLVGHYGIGLPVALVIGLMVQQSVIGLWWGLSAGLGTVAVALFLRFERLTRRDVVPLHAR